MTWMKKAVFTYCYTENIHTSSNRQSGLLATMGFSPLWGGNSSQQSIERFVSLILPRSQWGRWWGLGFLLEQRKIDQDSSPPTPYPHMIEDSPHLRSEALLVQGGPCGLVLPHVILSITLVLIRRWSLEKGQQSSEAFLLLRGEARPIWAASYLEKGGGGSEHKPVYLPPDVKHFIGDHFCNFCDGLIRMVSLLFHYYCC